MESTARAERFELPSASPAYLWEVSQKPVSVRIPFTIVDRLEGEAMETFRSLNSRGSEIGGVLFGKTSTGEPALISIDDYELIACDYSRGPLYRLSDADLGRFDRIIAQHAASGEVPVVGFFRSHTRKGVALDAEDLILFETRFKDPRKIALLIRPFATKASTGGIFIWEGGSVRGEASHREFPFRSSQLSAFRPGGESSDGGMAIAGIGGALPAPSVPKTATRAQIVPIASRREIAPAIPALAAETSLPEVAPEGNPPVSSAAPAAAPEAKIPAVQPSEPAPVPPAAAPVPEPAAKAAPASKTSPAQKAEPAARAVPDLKTPPAPKAELAVTAEPAAKPAPAERTEPAPPVAPVATAVVAPTAKREELPDKSEPAPLPEPLFARLATPEVQPATAARAVNSKLTWAAVGAVVPVVLMVLLFLYPGLLRRGPKSPFTPAVDNSALALRVERTGGELQLSWNRNSDPIRVATGGVLSISDGPQHQDVVMDLPLLQKGSINYTPATSDVVFRLEISGKGSKPASEMVRALSTRPSPMPSADPAGAKPGTPSGKPADNPASNPTVTAAAPAAADQAQPEEEPAKTPARPLKPFQAESLSQRLHPAPAASTDLPDAPSVGRGIAPAVSVPGINMNAIAPPMAPPAPAAPSPSLPAEKAIATGGQIQPAVLIRRKEPDYPRLARETGAKGTVELMATIGADGKVKKVSVVKGHPMLVKAASDAVMQWVYKPTILNGVAVEAQTQVLVNFMGEGR